MTQTAGLALASDRATDETRPQVVALLYVMFLAGMAVASVVFGWLLTDFSPLRLVRVVQGAAAAGIILNLIALWRQERVRPMSKAEREAPRPRFRDAWADYLSGGTAGRLLAVVFVGTMGFTMQDVLLEPYGGQVLGLSVSATTLLTAMWAIGALAGFALAAWRLKRAASPCRMAGTGLLVGIVAFAVVILSAPFDSVALFFLGAGLIGFGSGHFAVSTLTVAMTMPETRSAGRGLALGAWGAAQATAAGLSIALGGGLRDWINSAALAGDLGVALDTPATGYAAVYHLEIVLLFLTLAVLGPLVRTAPRHASSVRIGLADFPT